MTKEQLYKEITTRGNKLCYPFNYNNQNIDFLDYWLKLVDEYRERIKLLDESCLNELNNAFDWLPSENKPPKRHNFLRDVDAMKEIVKDFFQKSFRCDNEEALESLHKFMMEDDAFYMKMFPTAKLIGAEFYRVRTDLEKKPSYDDGDMFHVPFELRGKVGSTRFGFPGYPILYLSGSLETALCELGKPTRYTCAQFRFSQEIELLDLSMPWGPKVKDWELYSVFATYPLLMGCMVSVKIPSDPYKPEYILPQAMTKILRENSRRFSGILYMSNKVTTAEPNPLQVRNIALLVANTLARSGYDRNYLASKLQMSPPIFVDDTQKKTIFDGQFHNLDLPMKE